MMIVLAAWIAGAEASPALGVAAAVAPETSGWSAGATLTSDTFTGLDPRVLHSIAGVLPGDRALVVGGGLDLPVMLWIRGGGLDTGRLVLQASGEPARVGAFGLALHAQTRFGLQRDDLGTRLPWDLSLVVAPGLHAGERTFVGLEAGWQQGLATYVSNGDAVAAAFEDRYPDGSAGGGPKSGWLPFPSARWTLGGVVTTSVGPRTQLALGGGGVGTPSPFDTGAFDRMMIGVWPFFVELGATVGW